MPGHGSPRPEDEAANPKRVVTRAPGDPLANLGGGRYQVAIPIRKYPEAGPAERDPDDPNDWAGGEYDRAWAGSHLDRSY